MSKQRRRQKRTKHTRSRRSYIRNGVEQLENRVLPGGFLDLLAGAAFASNFDLLPAEQLVPEEVDSEFDASSQLTQVVTASSGSVLSLPALDPEPSEELAELAPADEFIDRTPATSATTSTLLATSIFDSFFASNEFADTSPSFAISPSRPLPTLQRSFSSPISRLGAGIGSGVGQGDNATGAELPLDSSVSTLPAWALGEGEGETAMSGSAAVSGSASGSGSGAMSMSMTCTAGASIGFSVSPTGPAAMAVAAGPTVLMTVEEGESFELAYEKQGVGDIGHFTVDWGDGSGETGPYYDGDTLSHSYYDDDPTNTPSDDYTATVTTYDYCGGQSGNATGAITVENVAPVAEDDIADADEEYGVSIDVLSNDYDNGPDSLEVVSIDTSGTKGKVTLEPDGTMTYDPDGKFNGLFNGETATDAFAYVVRDDDTGESTGTVTVTIHGATHVPVLSSGASIDFSDSHTFDLLVYHDTWHGSYKAIPVATEQLFPDARSNTLHISAASTGSWFRPPFFFSARSAVISYDVTFTCNGNKITANTNAPVKKETNVFVQAAADSKATYNANQTQVTIDVGLASVYGNAPSTTISFGSEDSGDTIGASIEISGATWDIATTGTFVYACQRW